MLRKIVRDLADAPDPNARRQTGRDGRVLFFFHGRRRMKMRKHFCSFTQDRANDFQSRVLVLSVGPHRDFLALAQRQRKHLINIRRVCPRLAAHDFGLRRQRAQKFRHHARGADMDTVRAQNPNLCFFHWYASSSCAIFVKPFRHQKKFSSFRRKFPSGMSVSVDRAFHT